MVTIHCVSSSCLDRVLCPKSCIIELKAFCMDWAALPARSWGGGANPQAEHTAPDPQPRCTVVKRLDLHPSAHKSFLSPVSSHTKWLHRDLDWKNVSCSVMVRMWRSDTETPPGTGTEAGVDLYHCDPQSTEWTYLWYQWGAAQGAGVWLMWQLPFYFSGNWSPVSKTTPVCQVEIL